MDALGGWNSYRKTVTPFKAPGKHSAEELLWNLTEAVEAGAVNTENFLVKFFKDPDDILAFADALEEYGEDGFWVNERFFQAMERALVTDETNLATFALMADAFREAAKDVKAAAKAAAKAPAKKAKKV